MTSAACTTSATCIANVICTLQRHARQVRHTHSSSMRDKRDMQALATCVFCSIGRFIPIAYRAIYGGGATCVLPPQDMCSVVGSFIPLCQITPFQNKSRWPHFKIVQFPNNPIWGHLKWDFSPFVSNIVIWGQGLRHRERLQCGQKSVVTLNAWIVTS